MSFEFKKRPPRQPLSPEEVLNLIYRKQIQQQKIIEKFKKTRLYRSLNIFNVVAIVIYTEIIFCFLSVTNYTAHSVQSATGYYGDKLIGGKRIYTSAIITTTENRTYDITIHDTCTLPRSGNKFLVGSDWILQKEIKSRFEESDSTFFIKRAFPLLFVSILMGIVTFVLFGYNLNQNRYSLQVISFINALSIFYFLVI